MNRLLKQIQVFTNVSVQVSILLCKVKVSVDAPLLTGNQVTNRLVDTC